jgi:O-antigen/teichoic acid export membrane protein
LISLGLVMVTEVLRLGIAYRVCSGLKMGLGYIRWSHMRTMITFGAKSSIIGLPQLIAIQGINILVTSHLGPGALAILARPNGLVRNAQAILGKFAFMLTPTAGSLQASKRYNELRDLIIQTTRINVLLALPILLFLSVMGDQLMLLWMGQQYAIGSVLAILSVGYFLPLSQQPIIAILTGMNMHGRIGLTSTVTTLIVFGLCVGCLNYVGWSLEGAALATVIPLTVGVGITVPAMACHKVGISIMELTRRAVLQPIIFVAPFGICLLFGRLFIANSPLKALSFGCVAGIFALMPLYWWRVVPLPLRKRIYNAVLERVTWPSTERQHGKFQREKTNVTDR